MLQSTTVNYSKIHIKFMFRKPFGMFKIHIVLYSTYQYNNLSQILNKREAKLFSSHVTRPTGDDN